MLGVVTLKGGLRLVGVGLCRDPTPCVVTLCYNKKATRAANVGSAIWVDIATH